MKKSKETEYYMIPETLETMIMSDDKEMRKLAEIALSRHRAFKIKWAGTTNVKIRFPKEANEEEMYYSVRNLIIHYRKGMKL